tara:strand:+ start:386 stop:691 length:306 start_codon:yes stop_codon:yes gene_type:complete
MVEPLQGSLCQPLAAALVVLGITFNLLKKVLMVALAGVLRGKTEVAALARLDKAIMEGTQNQPPVGGLAAAAEKGLLGQLALATLPALAETAQQVQSLGLL